MLLLAIPAGILIGLSLGALGGGGSILTVPALVYLLSLSPHQATTASLIIVGVTSLVGMAAHLRAGRVQVRSGVVFGVLGVGGAYAGSLLSAHVNPDVLLAAFSALMVGAAVTMLRRSRKGHTAAVAEPVDHPGAMAEPPLPGGLPGRASGGVAVLPSPTRVAAPPKRAPKVSPVRVVVAATMVGLVTGFFGVGGGFVVVPALVLALGFDMPTAVGTSLLVIAINSASSLATRLGAHSGIDVALLVVFTAAAMAGTVAGSRLASRIKPERLVGAFAVLMLAIAVYTATRSVPQLL